MCGIGGRHPDEQYDEGYARGREIHYRAELERIARHSECPKAIYNIAADALCWARMFSRGELLPRSAQGTINNCAVANGHPASECQVCNGTCPDAGKGTP